MGSIDNGETMGSRYKGQYGEEGWGGRSSRGG